MDSWIVLCLIFIPPCVALFFYIVLAIYNDVPKYRGKDYFTVHPHVSVLFGGGAAILAFTVFALIIFSPFPDPILGSHFFFFFLSIGLLTWISVYGFIYALRFRIVVEQDTITVYPLFSK